MHYRNGREARNGDKIVKLTGEGKVEAFGVHHRAVPGNDYCNGNIAIIQSSNDYACIVDCLHVDDVAAILAEKGLESAPQGYGAHESSRRYRICEFVYWRAIPACLWRWRIASGVAWPSTK